MASRAETILSPLREAANRAGLTDFLRWWWGELTAMVPAQWRERLSNRGVAYVMAEEDEWCVLHPAQGKLAQSGCVDLRALDLPGRRVALHRLIEESTGGGAVNVWLVLPPESVLVRTVALPLAAEESLRDAVGFELDRLTPFAAEHACFDFRVTGRDSASQRLTLDLAVAPRAPVIGRLAELRELGAAVLGVGVGDDLATSAAPFNLLAPEARERPATSRSAVAIRVLAAVAGMLALAALVYPLWQKREAVIALQPRLDKAKAGADVAERLTREIEKLAAEHNFLLARKQGQYPTVMLVEELSRILPDTTWVQQLDIKSGPKTRELQIAGETGSSSQLIEVLEKSGSLTNASFKSPLTKGVTPGTERFLVSAEVKPRPLPEPVAEAALMAAAGTLTPNLAPANAAAGVTPPVPPPAGPGAAAISATPSSAAAAPVPAAAAPASSGTAAPPPAKAPAPAAPASAGTTVPPPAKAPASAAPASAGTTVPPPAKAPAPAPPSRPGGKG